MQGLIIFVIVVVISAVIGGITQLLKKAQQAEQERLAQRRATSRRGANGDRPPPGDIDRFLEEIDKLRRKGGVEPPVARPSAPPIPTVAPSLPRPADPVFGVTAPPQAPRALPRLEDLPVAAPAPQRAAPVVARRAIPGPRKPEPKTEFGRQLVGMMGSKQSVALAVVLQEVLGPPKCKTRRI